MPVIDSTNPPDQTPVSVDASTTPVVSDQVADQRAFKAKYGINNTGMTMDQISDAIKSGQEDQVRGTIATNLDVTKANSAYDIINQVASRQGPLTPEQAGYVFNRVAALKQPTDPRSVFEEYYGQEYMNAVQKAAQNNPDSEVAKAIQLMPENFQSSYMLGATDTVKNEFTRTIAQNLEAEVGQQSWTGWLVDQAKTLFPGYTEYKLRGNTPGANFFNFDYRGQNLNYQMQIARRMPFPQYKDWLINTTNNLKKDNPELALRFAQAMLGLSYSDENMENMGTLLDASMIKPTAAIAKGLSERSMGKAVSKAITDVVKAGKDPAISRAGISEAAGDIGEAAVVKATDNYIADAKGLSDPAQRNLDAIHSYFVRSVDAINSNAGPSSRELLTRIEQAYQRVGDNFSAAIENTMRVDRLPAVFAVEKNIRAIKDAIRDKFPGLDNAILDISTPTRDPITNLYNVGIHIGQNDGTLFGSEAGARKFIVNSGLTGEVVKTEGPIHGPGPISKGPGPVQQGVGWKVVINKPLKETDQVIRDALLATSTTKTPASWINAWGGRLGAFRTPEDTLAMENIMARKVASYAPANFIRVIKDSAKEINDLKPSWLARPGSAARTKWDEWNRVMAAAKKDQQSTGELFNHPSQLQDLYQRTVGRLADDQEMLASFAFKRQEDLGEIFRNIGRVRSEGRLGAETHTISILNPDRQTFVPNAGSIGVKKITVNGIKRTNLDGLRDDSIAFIGNSMDDVRVRPTSGIKGKARESLQEKLNNGSKQLIEFTHPEEFPLKEIPAVGTSTMPRYAVVDKLETRPIAWNEYKPRPRPADYDYEHYITQAHVNYDNVSRIYSYIKDNVIGAHQIGAAARDIAKRLDETRKFIKSGNYDEAESVNPLSTPFNEVRGWFEGVNGELPKLSIDEPIHAVPRGRMVGDVDRDIKGRYQVGKDGKPASFRNLTTEGYGKYLEGRRDVDQLWTAEFDGTKANPLYKVTPAEAVDPITSVNRGLNKVLNATFMDDYKIMSIEHWIQEARANKVMSVSDEKLQESPYFYFFNPKWFDGGDPDKAKIINNLKTAQFQIRQFLGIQNQTTTFLNYTAQKLADSLYSAGHQKLALVPAYLLPTLRDPFKFIRSFTFDAKLGLFNPGTFLSNLNTYATIHGIAGFKYAAPGTRAAWTHFMTRANQHPEILTALDKLMSKKIIPGTSGWRPGEWMEAYKLMESSGFGNVGYEHARLDNPTGYNLITRGIRDNILNPAAVFFTQSEKLVRYGAFYTAFREFRDKVPARALTDADKRAILQRADLLSVNMSRASNSMVNSGVFTIPSQFLTYQLRTAELFLGKRLTTTERMRLTLTYMGLYGVPGALGLTGLPIADYVNRWVGESTNYTPGKDFMASAFWEGGMSAMLAMASGGNWYNVQEKYGVQGLETLREAMRSDSTMLDIIGGASFSTLWNTIASTDGFWKFLGGMYGDEDKKYQPTMDNFLDIFREISSVSNAWKLYHALNTGKVYSRNENLLTDNISPENAIFRYLSGLSSSQEANANIQAWSVKKAKEYQSHTLQQFIKEYRRGLRAEIDDNNPTEAQTHYRNAKAWLLSGDYPREKWNDAYSIATKGYETYVDRMNKNFLLKDVFESQKDPRRQQYENIQLMKQGQ